MSSANKRQRIVTLPQLDDDTIIPTKGQTVLGKRIRNLNNDFYYNKNSNCAKTNDFENNDDNLDNHNDNYNDNHDDDHDEKNHNQHEDATMNDITNNNNNNDTDNINDNNTSNNYVHKNSNYSNNIEPVTNHNNINYNNNFKDEIKFERGQRLDVLIEDENKDHCWVAGTIAKILNERQVLIHISRVGQRILDKNSDEVAPYGFYTDNCNR